MSSSFLYLFVNQAQWPEVVGFTDHNHLAPFRTVFDPHLHGAKDLLSESERGLNRRSRGAVFSGEKNALAMLLHQDM